MSEATIALIILATVTLLFITEIIPLAATSMGGAIVCGMVGLLPLDEVFSGLSDSSIVLFAGMFVIGASMFYTGLAQKIGAGIIRTCGTGESGLMFGIMVAATILSAFLSNTGTCACLLPVVLGICASSKNQASRQLMPLALACGWGGTITMVGTPPNIIANQALAAAKVQGFTFFEYAWIGIPLSVAGMLYMMLYGKRFLPKTDFNVGEKPDQQGSAAASDIGKQTIAGAILIGVVAVMTLSGLDPQTSYFAAISLKGKITLEMAACIGAILCVLTKCLTEKQAYSSIDWVTILLFAGMAPISAAMDKTGAVTLLTGTIVDGMGGSISPYALMAILFILSCALTQFMANTASAALLCPIGVSMANQLGASPQAVVMSIAVAASCAFATPIGTMPNTLVLNAGHYKFMDYVKVGTGLLVVCFVVCMLIIPLVWPFFPGK